MRQSGRSTIAWRHCGARCRFRREKLRKDIRRDYDIRQKNDKTGLIHSRELATHQRAKSQPTKSNSQRLPVDVVVYWYAQLVSTVLVALYA